MIKMMIWEILKVFSWFIMLYFKEEREREGERERERERETIT